MKFMGEDFFNKIVYSSSTEDTESERRALQVGADDTILCITGSGARPLDLLIDSPYKIISIDMNCSQNHLLELKMAAIKALDYTGFCEFIGLTASGTRGLVYKKISHYLSEDAKSWWDKQLELIEAGVLYCGRWERLLRGIRRFLFFATRRIGRLMNARDREDQQVIWKREWDNPAWRLFLKIISNRFLWKFIIREPGAKLIPAGFNVYSYMKERLDHMIASFELRKNHFANMIFYGYYGSDAILPHHLRRENFNIIKQNIDSIEIVTGTLAEYLDSGEEIFTAYSLSDFSSYTTSGSYINVWQGIVKSAINEAKFCERQFLVKRNPEKECQGINRIKLLEKSLSEFDETAIYTFCAGNINKMEEDD